MTTYKREITKEEYDEIMKESNGKGILPDRLKSKYFDVSILCGYGLYSAGVREKDGKYYLVYSIGDSCD